MEASFIIESSLEDSATCLFLPKLCGKPKLLSSSPLSPSLRLPLSLPPPHKDLVRKHHTEDSDADLSPRLLRLKTQLVTDALSLNFLFLKPSFMGPFYSFFFFLSARVVKENALVFCVTDVEC